MNESMNQFDLDRLSGNAQPWMSHTKSSQHTVDANDGELKIVFLVAATYGVERLGIQILSPIAEEVGYSPSFFSLDDFDEDDLIQTIVDIKPDVIAYTAITFEHVSLERLNKALKKRMSFISIFGGSHYTFSPEGIKCDESMDVVCVGEGEVAFRAFLEHVKNNTDYSEVQNLMLRQDGTVRRNPVGALMENLDDVPFADRQMVLLDNDGRRYMGQTCMIMISRGCPYLCTYCFNADYNKLYKSVSPNKIRWRSVGNVIDEMKQIKEEGDVDYISIIDDTFNLLPKEYVLEFCERYKNEISIPFMAQFRANLFDEELIVALKDAGMISINCAIECGDEDVSRDILKRGMTNERLLEAFHVFYDCGVKSYAQNIVGLPVEDPVEDALKTIRLNIKAKVTYAHFTLLLPFPKTPIETYCKKHGYLVDVNTPVETQRVSALGQNQTMAPSVFTKTTLRYKSEKDNRQINNLHKFASICVRYPFLLPLVKQLIKLPPNIIFQYVYFLWQGYNRTVVLYGTKISFSLIFAGIKQISGYLRKHA